ncbi:flavin reductase family protein [Plantactinospora sp. B6F1]|uniref:flavin reductase family protein n=1 Tax=Plantactinospora sp. B6F1 TaxID=3158971 RepID=UPI0010DB383B
MGLQAYSGQAGLDPAAFKEAMSYLAAPVAVVTTRDHEGRWWGFTASSVMSVSLTPPLVLVGVAHESSCLDVLAEAPWFVVNLLGEQHQHVARRFATRGIDRFAEQDFLVCADTMVPLLADAHAAFRCRRVDRILAGDHDLLLGEPVEVRTQASAQPLLWYRREFHVAARQIR